MSMRSLPLLDVRSQVQLKGKRSPWLCMQIPIRVRNLLEVSDYYQPISKDDLQPQGSTLHPHVQVAKL
jgi:hypothetical protein